MDHVLVILFVVGDTALLSLRLGAWMKRAMDPAPGQADRLTGLSAGIAGISGEQDRKRHLVTLMILDLIRFTVTSAILATQPWLRLNPDGKGALDPTLVFNAAASFTTNTNLQHCSGEVSMSHLQPARRTQAAPARLRRDRHRGAGGDGARDRGSRHGRHLHNRPAARQLPRSPAGGTRGVLMVVGGVPMRLQGAVTATTLKGATQTIARGPVAAVLTIKQFGTHGGGFFGPNATHPLENPTFWTNALATVAIIIPMSCMSMFGQMRHAVLILGGTALFAATSRGQATVHDPGARGVSEILFEFTFAAANTGSGFEGPGNGTGPWTIATGIVMLPGRYLPMILLFAIVGSLMSKRRAAESAGTRGVEDATFGTLLGSTLFIFGALTFLPSAALGPIAGHFALPRAAPAGEAFMSDCLSDLRVAGATMGIRVAGYTALILGIARTVPPGAANASRVTGADGTVIGSPLIAQPFTAPGHVWPRPLAVDYDAAGVPRI